LIVRFVELRIQFTKKRMWHIFF